MPTGFAFWSEAIAIAMNVAAKKIVVGLVGGDKGQAVGDLKHIGGESMQVPDQEPLVSGTAFCRPNWIRPTQTQSDDFVCFDREEPASSRQFYRAATALPPGRLIWACQ
jgi:hypothetical protein